MTVEVLNKPPVDDYGFVIKPQFKHHNYTEMETFLKDMNESYPNITFLKSIGKSVNGRDLYVMVVSSTPFKHVAGKETPFGFCTRKIYFIRMCFLREAGV